jgi:anthranilate synthase component I
MSETLLFSSETLTVNADSATPVSLYANLRQIFPESLLLECAEYNSPNAARSYLCADPVAKFSVKRSAVATIEKSGRKIAEIVFDDWQSLIAVFDDFKKSLQIELSENDLTALFGYVGFSAIPLFEDIKFPKLPEENEQIPDFQFALYRYVFRFDHFHSEMTALKLTAADENAETSVALADLLDKITYNRAPEYGFARAGDEISNLTDEEFAETVRVCQRHIRRGDVFQIVPSRKFAQRFGGDEFQVYRALRRINPSPFLFFFDYGNFSLFGSSPEAQILVRENAATIHPIAGTYRRGANKSEDLKLAETLRNDPKETAEHVMLVDLARNDLGRHCRKVRVEAFKEIEFYSHVIHLVSRVSGELNENVSATQIFADTFPAGTLSGAPKYRALQILNEIEPTARSFYGGSVGFFSRAGGECVQAIMIRSFLARRRTLIFQAGAGIVADSEPETETAEVRNKLAALRRAIEMAEKIR